MIYANANTAADNRGCHNVKNSLNALRHIAAISLLIRHVLLFLRILSELDSRTQIMKGIFVHREPEAVILQLPRNQVCLADQPKPVEKPHALTWLPHKVDSCAPLSSGGG